MPGHSLTGEGLRRARTLLSVRWRGQHGSFEPRHRSRERDRSIPSLMRLARQKCHIGRHAHLMVCRRVRSRDVFCGACDAGVGLGRLSGRSHASHGGLWIEVVQAGLVKRTRQQPHTEIYVRHIDLFNLVTPLRQKCAMPESCRTRDFCMSLLGC